MSHPLRRFLGVEKDADDRALLGLTVPLRRLTAAQVDMALAERLTRLARHPDAETDDARAVRQRLIAAAERLRPAAIGRADVAPPASPQRLDGQRSSLDSQPTADAAAIGGVAATKPVRPSGSGGSRESVGRGVEGDRTEDGESNGPAPPRHPSGSTVAPVRPGRAAGGGAGAPRRPSGSSPVVRPRAPIRLTAFDRSVLAVLVASGGWNARSRSLLVSLAGARGIPPEALVQLVRGLGQHVREGGGRPGAGELSESIGAVPWRTPVREPSRLERVVERIEETVADELVSDRLASRFRVTAIFAVLTLVSGAVLLRILLAPSAPPPPPREVAAAEAVESVDAAGGRASARTPSEVPIGDGTVATPAGLIFVGGDPMRGERRPVEARAAFDAVSALSEELDQVRRHASIAQDRPSEIMRRRWIAAVGEAGAAWPLLDPSTRARLLDAFAGVLRESASPSVSDALLDAVQPRSVGREPLDLWRAAFAAGLLAETVRRSPTMAPVTVARAAEHLRGWTGAVIHASDTDFAHAAGVVLDRQIARLIDDTIAVPVSRRDVDQAIADRWEAWIEAQRALRSDLRMQQSLVATIETLLRTGRDLSAPGTMSALVVRLVELLQPAWPGLRGTILRWYLDDSIDSAAMWVVTGLLLTQRKPPELVRDLTVPWNASTSQRESLADRLAARWPEESVAVGPSARRWTDVSEQMRNRWLTMRDAAEAAAEDAIARGGDADRVFALLVVSLVNEAMACLVIGDEPGAEERIAMARDVSSADTQRLRRNPLRRLGVSRGRQRPNDGAFAEAFRGDRDHESRLGRLRALRLEAVGDLGPIDAAELARIALRSGQAAEVRNFARTMIVEQFQYGPETMAAMLDTLPDAILNEELAEAITRITGRALPPPRAAGWMAEARMALLEHVIVLEDGPLARLDLHAENLAESYRQRLLLAGSDVAVVSPDERQPHVAIAALVDAWRERAETVVATRPLLDTVEIDRRRLLRRRLAEAGVARLVGEQITLLELAATVVSGEAPALREEIEAVLVESSVERRGARTALEQAVMTEVALTRLWRLAIGEDPRSEIDTTTGEPRRDREGTDPERPADPVDGDDVLPPDDPDGPRRPGTRQDQIPIEPPRSPRPTRGRRRETGLELDRISRIGDRGQGRVAPPVRTVRVRSTATCRMALAPLLLAAIAVAATVVPTSGASSAAVASSGSTGAPDDPLGRWQGRLVALAPNDPDAYFLLGEEVAEAASTPAERQLAVQLLGLGGALSPDRLARSAALALADLAESPEERRRFRSAATLLDRSGGTLLPVEPSEAVVERAVALAFSEMLSHLRLGQGQIAIRTLSRPEIRRLLDRHERDFGLQPGHVEADIGAYRGGGRRPRYDDGVGARMRRIELGLIAGAGRPFGSDLLLDNEPLTEIDPSRLDELFGVDSARNLWRDGRWATRD